MAKHLRITVVRAMDLHTHTLTPPSPYIILTIGSEKKQTQPKHHEHNPAYQDSFSFDVNDPNIGVLDIEARSHGIENHLIGRAEVPINLVPNGTPKREIVQLNPRGQVEVELFAEDYGLQQGYGYPQQGFAPQGYGYPQQGYPQQGGYDGYSQQGYPPQGGYDGYPQQGGYGGYPN